VISLSNVQDLKLIESTSSILFLVFRNSWAYLFNSDIRVVKMVAQVLPLVAVFQVILRY
jgi:MATE family multidrug resistance protein